MNKVLGLLVSSLAVVAVACSDSDAPKDVSKNTNVNGVLGTAAEITFTPSPQQTNEYQGEFAFKVIKNLNELTLNEGLDQNFAVSPFSAYSMLSLYANSLTGESQKAFTDMLGQSSIDALNEYNSLLMERLPAVDPEMVKFKQGYAVWLNSEFSPRNVENFSSVVDEYYSAPVCLTSFKRDKVMQKVKAWVMDITDGAFKGFLPKYPAEKSMISHCLLFEGKWYMTFDKSDTKPEPFYNEKGEQIANVPTMCGSQLVTEAETEKANIYKLYYGNGGFSLKLLLPKQNVTLDEAVASIDYQTWKNAWSEAENSDSKRERKVYLPKLSVNVGSRMEEALERMGMKHETLESDLFGSADLDVFQSGDFSLDENGSVMTVATGEFIVISPGHTTDINLNRPFAMYLEEESTGVILLFAKIFKP